MADRPQVRIEGLDRFLRTMGQATDELANLEDAATATGDLVAAEAGRRAPRRTGRLSSSIVAGVGPNQTVVGSDLVYAPVIHWGWPARNIEPEPFLVEAAEATRPSWEEAYQTDVQKTLDDVKGA
jgi:phage gpG-like protein